MILLKTYILLSQQKLNMTETLIFTLTTFAMFAIWNESYRLRLILRAYIEQIGNTWGRAKWVYSNRKETQSWMLK